MSERSHSSPLGQLSAHCRPTGTQVQNQYIDADVWRLNSRQSGKITLPKASRTCIASASGQNEIFLQAVRSKRGAAGRDVLPDEAFMRLRGSLFFGPAFLVTRNKLTFRDNLRDLLGAAGPGRDLIYNRASVSS